MEGYSRSIVFARFPMKLNAKKSALEFPLKIKCGIYQLLKIHLRYAIQHQSSRTLSVIFALL